MQQYDTLVQSVIYRWNIHAFSVHCSNSEIVATEVANRTKNIFFRCSTYTL